jgi:hypothetical protein
MNAIGMDDLNLKFETAPYVEFHAPALNVQRIGTGKHDFQLANGTRRLRVDSKRIRVRKGKGHHRL